jgi:hypothetical protein
MLGFAEQGRIAGMPVYGCSASSRRSIQHDVPMNFLLQADDDVHRGRYREKLATRSSISTFSKDHDCGITFFVVACRYPRIYNPGRNEGGLALFQVAGFPLLIPLSPSFRFRHGVIV